MKNKNLSLIRLWTTIALALVVSACGTTTGSFFSGGSQFDVTAAPTQTAEYYKLNAQQARESEKVNWQIMELKAYIIAEDYNSASQLLTTLNALPQESLSHMQLAEIAIADAKVLQAIAKDGDKLALQRLNFPAQWELSDSQWLESYLLRADLYEATDEHFEASRALINAKNYIDTSEYTQINDLIWMNLRQYSEDEIISLTSRTSATEIELTKWLDLAHEVKSQGNSPANAQKAVQQWFSANSEHSAVVYTPPSLESLLNLELISPTNIALLLPQEGNIAKAASLIEQGFTRALLNDQRAGNALVTSTIYNTSNADMSAIYQQLKEANIDFVIGPLQKDNVEAFQEINTDINMLALNLPKQTDKDERICYVTLSPEQEAEQTAKYFIEQGYSKPLVLHSNNGLGKRISKAFNEAWTQYATTSASTGIYDTSRKNITASLRRAFNARGTTDAIYIIGNREQIAIVKNYIPVAINSKGALPPIFANSKSNTGKAMAFHDLGGVQFPDIPLIVNEDTTDNDTEKFGYDNEAKRIYSLGMDTYTLSQNLPSMKVSDSYAVPGKSGILTVGKDCVILRELSWTEFEQGSDTDEEENVDETQEDSSQENEQQEAESSAETTEEI